MSDEQQIRDAAKDLVDPKRAGDGPSEKELEPSMPTDPPVEDPDRPREGGGGGNTGGG
jgi:hypothetical protein